jgi:hypothetical protein
MLGVNFVNDNGQDDLNSKKLSLQVPRLIGSMHDIDISWEEIVIPLVIAILIIIVSL